MKITQTALPGVVLIEPKVFSDTRGFFVETYHSERYRDAGIGLPFVQDNHSRSGRHVLRGLHLQRNHPQGKLVRVVTGRVWDVAVDVNPKSSTFKKWVAAELDDRRHHQLYIPPGYAHGFVVLSESADVAYKCTDVYHPGDEVGVLWSDPDLAIDWPVTTPIVSERDATSPSLSLFIARSSQ